MYKTRLIKEKWLKKQENIPETACKQHTLDATFKFDACIGGVVMKKARAKERIFLFVMILVNGMRKTSVLNCLIC
jgi:hypothetical protein